MSNQDSDVKTSKVVNFPAAVQPVLDNNLLDEEEISIVLAGTLERFPDGVREDDACKIVSWASSAKAIAIMYDLVMSGDAVVGIVDGQISIFPSMDVAEVLGG